MIRLRPSGADEVLIKRVRDWYEPGPGVFIAPQALFNPALLFTTGVNGAWYDPSDLNTLFQDAAGTTPVTAVEQPVSLMLDKSKGLVLGPELVANGDFSQGTTGWTNSSTGTGTFTASSGAATIIGTDGSNRGAFSQNIGVVAGRFYKVSFDATITSGAGSFFGSGPGSAGGAIVSGANAYYIAAAAGGSFFVYTNSGGGNITIDNISVRELPGNHAFNPSGNSANFPVLKQDETGRKYLSFNGTNQWLQTNSIDFSYGDKMFVCAGVRKLSDAARGVLAELSTNLGANNGTFLFDAPAVNGSPNARFGSKGTVFSQAAIETVLVAPTTIVLSGIGNIGGKVATLRANASTAVTSTSDQGTGNYGNYPLYIGARAGSSLWFNGRLHQLVVAGKQASASEIGQTEAFINQKTGAY